MIAIAFAIAQLTDFYTANPSTEVHPVGAVLLTTPALALAAKVTLIVFCLAVASIAKRKHARVGSVVLVFGTLAGVVGTLSNL